MIIYSIRKIKIGPTLLTGATERGNHHRWLGRLPVRARETWRSRGSEGGDEVRGWTFLQLFIFTSLIARILRGKNYEIALCALCACSLSSCPLATLCALFFFQRLYVPHGSVTTITIADISQEFSERSGYLAIKVQCYINWIWFLIQGIPNEDSFLPGEKCVYNFLVIIQLSLVP